MSSCGKWGTGPASVTIMRGAFSPSLAEVITGVSGEPCVFLSQCCRKIREIYMGLAALSASGA